MVNAGNTDCRVNVMCEPPFYTGTLSTPATIVSPPQCSSDAATVGKWHGTCDMNMRTSSERKGRMEVLTRYLRDKRSETVVRGHSVVCDQPMDKGGTDQGMTPPELLLAALGACGMHYAAEYLRARRQSLDGLEIRVAGTQGDRPARIAEIQITVKVPPLEARHREGLLRAVEACLLHRTLLNPP